MQTTDLSALGLGGFAIEGLESQAKDASGKALPPELDLKATDGSGTVEHVDAQGNLYDQANNSTGTKLQFGDSSGNAAPPATTGDAAAQTAPATTGDAAAQAAPTTTGDASAAPAAPATTGDASAAPAAPATTGDASAPPAAPATAGDASVVPNAPATAGDAAATPPAPDSSDTGAAATPFGANGRSMQLSADGNSGSYGIQGGDTLWSIAQDALTPPGQTLTADEKTSMAPQIANMVQQIAQDNNISDPNEIYPGQQITINGLKAADSAAQTTIAGDASTDQSAANGSVYTTLMPMGIDQHSSTMRNTPQMLMAASPKRSAAMWHQTNQAMPEQLLLRKKTWMRAAI